MEKSDWTPRGDPVMAMLPEARPDSFDRLPWEEQMWRGRVFLIYYTITGGGLGYSWWQALRNDDPLDPDGSQVRAFIATVTDAEIISGLLGMQMKQAALDKPLTGPPS
jgi:hypothetical protein